LSDFIRSWTTVERRSFYANKQLTGSCNAVNLDFRPQVQRPGLATFVALGQQNPKKKKSLPKKYENFCHNSIECRPLRPFRAIFWYKVSKKLVALPVRWRKNRNSSESCDQFASQKDVGKKKTKKEILCVLVLINEEECPATDWVIDQERA